MRHFHYKKQQYHCPVVNVDQLWSMVPKEITDQIKKLGDANVAPIVDVTKMVCFLLFIFDSLIQGFFKVCGRGDFPAGKPLIVKSRYFSEQAEEKITAAGGKCILIA